MRLTSIAATVAVLFIASPVPKNYTPVPGVMQVRTCYTNCTRDSYPPYTQRCTTNCY